MFVTLPRLMLMACLLSPSLSWALGLGEIHLNSALNEPMNAEIDLIGADPDDLAALRATLATKESFHTLWHRSTPLPAVVDIQGGQEQGRPRRAAGAFNGSHPRALRDIPGGSQLGPRAAHARVHRIARSAGVYAGRAGQCGRAGGGAGWCADADSARGQACARNHPGRPKRPVPVKHRAPPKRRVLRQHRVLLPASGVMRRDRAAPRRGLGSLPATAIGSPRAIR